MGREIFSSNNLSLVQRDNTYQLLVDSGVLLAKMAINKYHSKNMLATKFSVVGESYDELNKTVLEKIYKYCADKAGITTFDYNRKEDVVRAMTNPIFEWNFFAIQTEILNNVNPDNEVEDVMIAANISTVGLGDSKTFEIDSKGLYKVQEGAYGNNVSRFQEHFKSAITLTPTPKVAAIDFDVTQMNGIGYDFGKQVAKIAMSFRVKMYTDVVSEIFTVANVSSTPFYKATFAKTTYMEMADRLAGANGSGVAAYGTRVAFGQIADGITTGFATQDEINKSGFIGNVYGVSSILFDQAVDSNTASFTFKVPSDKIVLLSPVGDRPVKVVRENNIMVINDDGKNNALYRRSYKFMDSWTVGLATQAAYGIQVV
jgi:hypothetical protein